ncbi:hypothetical protein NIES22_61950 [Calothrix brevissima NIES-22]|nr:hypothetical protein NIES22_61950 [Calothrix brevissima NIES-22]
MNKPHEKVVTEVRHSVEETFAISSLKYSGYWETEDLRIFPSDFS